MDKEIAKDILLEIMSAISEEYYAAGWMDGLEFALWRAVIQYREGFRHIRFGTVGIPMKKIQQLVALSEECDGWFYWSKGDGEKFITLEEWDKMYKEMP